MNRNRRLSTASLDSLRRRIADFLAGAGPLPRRALPAVAVVSVVRPVRGAGRPTRY